MKIFFSFLKMRREKQKAFVRNKFFQDLLILAKADTLASLPPDGKPKLGVYPEVLALAKELLEEDRRRPLEIINGKEIIAQLQYIRPTFEPSQNGKMIGTLKKRINTLYDRGEVKSKEEAYGALQKLAFGEESAKAKKAKQV